MANVRKMTSTTMPPPMTERDWFMIRLHGAGTTKRDDACNWQHALDKELYDFYVSKFFGGMSEHD